MTNQRFHSRHDVTLMINSIKYIQSINHQSHIMSTTESVIRHSIVNMMMYCKIYQNNESLIAFIYDCTSVQHNYLPSTAASFIFTVIYDK